ncbi:5'-nucleotidase isoform X2 [Alligator mississippiensis]|uniref:5'-nucleotidase isoform X2 n=1 Tax=Alligator mississippiensis TaxID=8496 RepID=UPI002877F6FB|nr:5'-nucleotidase isoform X2 [Alligator mississippiensis]
MRAVARLLAAGRTGGAAMGPGALALCVALCVARAAGGAVRLALLHTNDVHGRVEPAGREAGRCSPGAGGCYGGAARCLTAVRQLRARHRHVLLLDAGDQYQGTVWFSYYRGREVAFFMNRLGYDAMALGNHEFDNGLDGLLNPLLKSVDFPILSANIKAKKTIASSITGYILPYKIVNVGSEKIGIVGYTTKETSFLSNPGDDIMFEDEIEALQPQVDKLIDLGVNKIIALGHSGFMVDQQIAQKVRGVDIVVGGHTNTFLYTGPPPSSEVPVGNYPFMVRSDDNRLVPVVQAYAFGKYLGYLNVTFDEKGNVIQASGNPILLDSSIPEAQDLKAEVDKWRIPLDKYASKEIGKTNVYLNGTSQACRFHECNMGNMICDAMLYNAVGYPDENTWNHVSMCILNGGGIRSPIDEKINNGTITMEDLLAVLPFGMTFDLLVLKGSTLKEAFEHSVHRYGRGTGELLQVGGIHVVYDVSRTPRNRVVSIEVLCTACRVPTYVPLEMDKTYTVILPSFLYQGGDGYNMLKEKSLSYSRAVDNGTMDATSVWSMVLRWQLLCHKWL